MGPRFYLRLIRRTCWLWIYAYRTTDGRPFKPKKLSVPFLYPGVPAGRTNDFMLTWTIIKNNNCSFFLSLWMTLKTTRIWSFFDVWTFYVTPNCISLSDSRFILTFRYMTYQFKRNPNTIPVSNIICTCTTIFLKFYNKCENTENESGHHSSSC